MPHDRSPQNTPTVWPIVRTAFPLGLPLFLGGCFLQGATSFPIAGAYFPGWLTCLFIGVISAILFRALFLALNIDSFLSLRLFTYVSLGSLVGLILWVCLFGA
ncbi:YtcA family lipoprotein [Saccharibacter floricola]|uniref:YtcA family lipoprotein n=1 Tax=Saccharibacter floricola TaxID=231053 RepID=UPI00036B1DBF|nr:YtcA family lipoprotein [Saccharibacter floricola]